MELHRVGSTTLSARTQVCTVSEHFRKRHLRLDVLGVAVSFHALDTATAAGQVAHYVAHVVVWGHYFHAHDWLQNDGAGHLRCLTESHLARNFERHFAGVNVVVLTVDERHLDVHRWVTSKHAVVESRLDALVGWLNVFARNATTGDVVFEDVTAADATWLDSDLDNSELTGTTRLLDVAVFDRLDFFGDGLAVRHLRLTNSCIDTEFALHTVDKNFEVQLAHS